MKSKKILTILLSLAIMFTFMPAMAFADNNSTSPVGDFNTSQATKVVWAADGTSVSVTYGTGANAKTASLDNATIERVWDQDNGLVIAKVTYKSSVNYEALGEVEKMAYVDVHSDGCQILHSYADLSAAKVTNASDYKTYTYDQFYNGSSKKVDAETGVITGQGVDVYLSAPTYVKNYDESFHGFPKAKDANPVALSTLSQYSKLVTTVYASGFTKDNYEDMPVNLSATVFPQDAAMEGEYLTTVGTLSDNSVTVKGKIPASTDVKFGIDNLKTPGAFPTSDTYDGKEHTVVATEVPTLSVAYQVWNTTTKAWEDKTEVTYKDAKTYNIRYKVYKTADGAASVGWTPVTLTVGSSSKTPTVQFSTDSGVPSTFVTGKYDAWDYVEVVNAETDADKEALMAYFKAAYTIEETSTSKFDSTAYRWSFKAVDPEPKAKDYPILANYGTPVVPTSTKNVTILEKDPDYDYEIQFTKAISSKTYKGSKTTKKGKLKKNQTIQFTAEAANGTAVKYKLVNANSPKIKIDSTTGKLTLKKGLAKGTYSFKIKAYIPGTYNDNGQVISETHNVKIKVKK